MMLKRITAIVLVLMLIFSITAVSANAEDTTKYEKPNGNEPTDE